jgi:hypothetical protein
VYWRLSIDWQHPEIIAKDFAKAVETSNTIRAHCRRIEPSPAFNELAEKLRSPSAAPQGEMIPAQTLNLKEEREMKIAEQLLKHITTLSDAHMGAIHKTVAADFPLADPNPMHALVLVYQLGRLLQACDRDDEDSLTQTINAILAKAGGYRLVDTNPANTDNDWRDKMRTDLSEDKLKYLQAEAVQANRADIKYFARLAAMPPDDVAKEIYDRFAWYLDARLACAIGDQLRLSGEAAEPIAQAIISLRTQRGERRVMSTQSMAYITFSSYDGPIDVDGAAAALQAASYTVHRLPEKYRKYLELPLDDHMEAIYDNNPDIKIKDINAIVGKFGGDCLQCGPIATNYQPFVDLFANTPGFVP